LPPKAALGSSCPIQWTIPTRADGVERIALDRIGFPAILPVCAAGHVGDRQRKTIDGLGLFAAVNES